MSEVSTLKCPRCRCWRASESFYNVKGRKLKTCSKCREYSRKNKQKNKCVHNRIKSTCKDCGGVSICQHNRRKNECKDCGGASICQHNRIKRQCKECKDPIKITIKKWIGKCRNYDKKTNKFDPDNFIDTDFLNGLVEDYKNCIYCKTPLQFTHKQANLGTIERVCNGTGHIKSNCVLACLSCNIKRGNRYYYEEFKELMRNNRTY